ncbi:PLP-dependent aminotransferase family protein [Desmospora activa]|uniref:GntR family transcriptional regulator n=1 Tax=Desmospora activa DSM 45169 TaxID=1121389 RepID=A0A2T4Z3T2_9BACL|nr:PLP-dependent aminotransferase family protein [Desmospora activa]PTM56542.1 GntR family transcriptional regulator [Desmospora activa DSM 45169]
MNIKLNRGSTIPLARQIEEGIADRILSGHFDPGAQLPTVRELSRVLQVSPVTVTHALKLLEERRLVNRVKGKGVFVAADVVGTSWQQRKSEENNSPPIPDYVHRSQHFHFNRTAAAINLSLSTVHPHLLPTQALADSVTRMIAADPEVLAQFGEIQGDTELRNYLAQYMERERLQVSPEQILITNGSQQGIDLVARCFLGPGDIVVTEEPTYSAAIDVFKSRGATVWSVPVDQEGMRVERLLPLLDSGGSPKLIYTVPTFHNPTGTVMSERRRRELIELANQLNCLVLEDDPWSEVYFHEPPPPPLQALDRRGSVIYVKGLGKMLAPSCRVGYLIASGRVRERLLAAKANADLGNPLLNQKVVLALFQSQVFSRYLNRLRKDLAQKRDLAVRLLEEYAPTGVTWNVPRGGLNLWLSLPAGANALLLLERAEKESLHFLPGSACYPGDVEWNHLRISFSCVTDEELEQGIRLLGRLMQEYLTLPSGQKGTTPYF